MGVELGDQRRIRRVLGDLHLDRHGDVVDVVKRAPDDAPPALSELLIEAEAAEGRGGHRGFLPDRRSIGQDGRAVSSPSVFATLR